MAQVTFRERARLAWNVLRGRVEIKDAVVRCAREHVESSQSRISTAELKAYEQNNIELGIARGVLSQVDPVKYQQYLDTVQRTLQNVKQ